MKSLCKSLWIVLVLSGAAAGAAGCGPQQAFCPNSGNSQGVCPILGDDGPSQAGTSGGMLMCDAGFTYTLNTASGTFSCQPTK